MSSCAGHGKIATAKCIIHSHQGSDDDASKQKQIHKYKYTMAEAIIVILNIHHIYKDGDNNEIN